MAKIPAEAKKVFSGIVFDVYQWEQKMFDGNYKTFEMIKRPDTVNIILVNEIGEIILAQEQQPGKPETIGCFGGRVERNEDPVVSAKRELIEETGMEADKLELWYQFDPSEKIEWTIYTYIAKGLRITEGPNLESGEKNQPYTTTFDDFVEKVIFFENFRDLELTTRILKAQKDPMEFDKLKRLFTS